MEIDMSKGYDPDVIKKILDDIDARKFGILLARHFEKEKSSNNQGAVGYAIEHLDPWHFGFEWTEIQTLIKRIAEEVI